MIANKRNIAETFLDLDEVLLAEKTDSLCMRRIASWDTPTVEYAYQNTENNSTLAFFFVGKDADGDNNLKNCLDILSSYDVCIMCFDSTDLSGANNFCNELTETNLDTLAVGVLAYDKNGKIIVLKMYSHSDTSKKKRTAKENKSYWCWWRDASRYEIADLLILSEKYDSEEGDVYTTKVYPEFYERMINQQTKQWDGTPRKKNYSAASYKAEKQNYKIPMCQLGLWDVSTGHITPKGRLLLEVVNEYGSESKQYLNYLSKLILLDGKHLDLIKDISDFQRDCAELIPESSSDFFVMFDEYMDTKGSLGTRKPSAVTTGAKKAYVRDEPKLWNKLGFVILYSKGRYYWPFKGIKFDWDYINNILVSDIQDKSQGEI